MRPAWAADAPRASPASRESWVAVARACDYATYFHTPAWLDLMRAVHPQYRDATLQVILEDGTIAVCPALEYRWRGFLRGIESMVPGVYGGPIAERQLILPEVATIVSAFVTKRTAHVRIVGNPHASALQVPAPDAPHYTQLIDLRRGFEGVLAGFSKRRRQEYFALRREGLRARVATNASDWRQFEELYEATYASWGASAFDKQPAALFRELESRRDSGVVLWLVESGGRLVAGAICFYWNRTVIAWLGAADVEERLRSKKSPTMFLLTEIFRDAAERGHDWVDLGPSAGLEGVVRFKELFGAGRVGYRDADRAGSPFALGAARFIGRVAAKIR